LFNLKNQVLKEISTTAQHKCDIECMLTIDISVDQLIDKELAKVSNRNKVVIAQ
jgi:hypothetical protein